MKQIELNLQKRLLIMEAPEGELTAIGNDDEVYYAIKKDETYIKIVDGKKWKLICKGSELTEETAKGLVHQSIHTGLFAHYVKDIPVNTYCYKSALDSFISAIEAHSYYWGENPIEYPKQGSYEALMTTSWEGLNKIFDEAQSRTFNPERTFLFQML